MSKTQTVTIQLDTPIAREGGDVKSITLRKPMAGELRGLSLADLLNLDTDSLTKVLPRISQPTIHEHEIRLMDPADLVSVGKEVAGFLLPKALKVEPSPGA